VSAVQYDTLNLPLQMFAKDLIAANALMAENARVIKDWDGRMLMGSRSALFVNEIRNCVSNKMATDNKPVPASIIRERVLFWAVRENAARWVPKPYENYPAVIKACEAETTRSLSERLGTDQSKWNWGAVWTARFNHPLSAAPLIGAQFVIPRIPLDGSGQTPNVGSSVSMRHIASPGNWDATRHVIPLGESGDPRSSHFKDQFEAWLSGEPMVFPFSKAAVEKAGTSMLTLTPR